MLNILRQSFYRYHLHTFSMKVGRRISHSAAKIQNRFDAKTIN